MYVVLARRFGHDITTAKLFRCPVEYGISPGDVVVLPHDERALTGSASLDHRLRIAVSGIMDVRDTDIQQVFGREVDNTPIIGKALIDIFK